MNYLPGLFVYTDPVNIWITDPLGRSSGFNPETNLVVNEIPDALIFENDGNVEAAFIPAILDGTYTISMSAIEEESYSLVIEGRDDSNIILDQIFSGVIKDGEVLSSTLVIKENLQGELEAEAKTPSQQVVSMTLLLPEVLYAIVSVAIVAVIAIAILLIKKPKNNPTNED